MVAIEEIGDIGFGINITSTFNGEETTKTLADWIAEWDKLDDKSKKELIVQIQTEKNDKLFDEKGVGVNANTANALGQLLGLEGENAGANLFNNLIFDENGEIKNLDVAGYYMQLASAIS